MNSRILHRIKEYLDDNDISMRQFEMSVGMSNGSFGTQLRNNKSISSERLENILREYPKMNPTYIMTGRGNHSLPDGASDQVELTVGNRIVYLNGIRSGKLIADMIKEIANDKGVNYVLPDLHDGDFMIRVNSQTMYPKYRAGDVIACTFVEKGGFLQYGKPHFINTIKQGAILARIKSSPNKESITCVFEDPESDEFEIALDQIAELAIVRATFRLE